MSGGPQGYSMQHWNVAGGRLAPFQKEPPVGFYRDSFCRVGPEDKGNHSIAAEVNKEFLDFTVSKGNNLKDVGIKPGMKWCLCAHRWQEAMKAAQEGQLAKEAVPKVYLHASDRAALDTVSYKDLKAYAAEAENTSVRQGSHHSPENSQSIAKESQSIGGDQPTEGPGAGKNQSKGGSAANTSGNRG
ncbi:uncharacterized protein LTR77_002910 [Saxophila tyrrhenica]|uniref:Uncharacterized protein n=1 Tax=Saxophila tyrrhenica TaxID=1690608 RepID=A0AAV9PJK5_9PEZI|nr:hypothetical protein LTR77_002910 [Saxophila tyrrhenica]